MTAFARGWQRPLAYALARHRRLLSAVLAAGAVALTISALSPAPPPTVTVLAAARDLAGGTPLRPGDLTRIALPASAVPHGSIRAKGEATGRVLAGPMRQGEPLTDVQVVGAPLLRGYGDGLVAAPVRIADAGAVQLVATGDLVDVLAAESTVGTAGQADGGESIGTPARVVAPAARVVAIPRPTDGSSADDGPLGEGALLVLATTPDVAADLARAAVTARLSLTLRAQ